jgi:hypothetical protein
LGVLAGFVELVGVDVLDEDASQFFDVLVADSLLFGGLLGVGAEQIPAEVACE